MSTTSDSSPSPTQASTATPTPIPPALLAFLTSLKLEAYAAALAAAGWDDVDFLTTLPVKDLKVVANTAKMKPGHSAKFIWALSQKPGEPQPFDYDSAPKSATGEAMLAIIVDRSGSMSTMGSEVMTGFNSFLAEQQKIPGPCTATVIRFDNEVEVVHRGVPLADVPKADATTFQPRGMTALYDAIGKGIEEIEKQARLKHMPSRVMVMILTDGAENSSKRYTRSKISESIKRLTDEQKWEFVFIGANQDAIHTGTSIGVSAQNCLDFAADEAHQPAVWSTMSANCAGYRGTGSCGFTPAQRISTTL